MPQANAENRLLAQQAANRLLGVGRAARDRRGRWRETRRPARMRQHLVGRGRARQDRHAAAHVEQMPGDVPFHAVVQGHDVRRSDWRPASCRRIGQLRQRIKPLVQSIGPCGDHLADQVAADQARAGLGLGDQAGVVQIDGRKDTLHGPLGAKRRTSARVSIPSMADDTVPHQVSPSCRRRGSCLPGGFSRTTKPARCGFLLSTSSALTP